MTVETRAHPIAKTPLKCHPKRVKVQLILQYRISFICHLFSIYLFSIIIIIIFYCIYIYIYIFIIKVNYMLYISTAITLSDRAYVI